MTSTLESAPRGRREVGEFLADHEACGAGVRLLREAGGESSRVAIACAGCGDQVAYELGDPGLRAAPGPALRSSRRRPASGAWRPSREQMERWLPAPAALPWWVPNAYIAGVILVGLALVVFGLVGRDGTDRALLGGTGGDPSSEPQPASAPPVAAAGAAPAPPAPKPEPKEAPQAERVSGLKTVELANRFEIGMPEGWGGATVGGAIVLTEPGGDVLVRVFLEPGDRGPVALAREARGFVASEHPDARVAPTSRTTLGAAPAAAFVARYGGGEERATLLSERGYEYLVLARVSSGASKRDRALTAAALQRFKAL